MRIAALLGAGLALLAAGCGAPADPLPPLRNIPSRTTDLEAVQRGTELVVAWSVPALTTEGMPVTAVGRTVVLMADEEGALESAGRELAAVGAAETGQRIERRIPLPVEPGRRIALAVKNYSPRGRSDGHSNVVVVEVAAAPAAPGRPAAAVRADGVRLEWSAVAGASGYQVHRSGPDREEFTLLSEVPTTEFVDREVRWKARYRYFVRPYVTTSTGVAEGLDSPPVEVTPQDTFAPATPGGLQGAGGGAGVDLSWNPSPEPDAAGYYVYRDGVRLTREPLGAPAYTDRGTRSGQNYSYEISAVDAGGNESARSAPVLVTVP